MILPAVVIGPTVAIIGLSLAGNAVGDLLKGDVTKQVTEYAVSTDSGTPEIIETVSNVPVGSSYVAFVCGLITLAVVMLCSTYGKKTLKLIPFIIGILAGYAAAAIFTVIGNICDIDALKIVDFSIFSSYMLTDGSVSLKTFVSLPDFAFVSGLKGLKEFDFSYFATIFVAYVPVALVVFAEHVADHKNLSSIIDHDLLEEPGLTRTLLGDGVGSIAVCIIAHIDHGKSTLADRLLEFTNTIQVTEGQMLDDMDLEKERGITIKSHAIQMEYTYKGEKYILNLIDTPGHVDFSYEVSRSIAACEGALLVVDASQGVQAQTISNLYMALEHDLEIIPVMNKCDMASAMPEEVEDEIIDLLGCKREDIIRASGKTGMGVEDILAAVIERVPHPVGDDQAPLQALIFDSVFNSFRGIIAYFKIENGVIRKGDKVKFFNTGKEYDADEIGVLKMDMMPRNELRTGDVGYIISGIKTSREVKVGDTITHIARPCERAIAGFEEVKPMVFAGVYPIEAEDYENLRASLEKLQLNDASLTFQPESSLALGFGFRCGFLGLLHMEIVQERLDREFDMNVITTVPNVSYMVYDKQGHANEVHNPGGMPDPTLIDHIEEPYIDATVITATDYIGPIMTLCLGKRGELVRQNYVSGNRVEIHYRMPLGEIVIDFYDKLKSISKGYASFDYHQSGFRPSKLVKLDILLNGESVDALSTLTHVDNAYDLGKRMCEKLKELIPRQQFDIAIQAAIGAKIISRETIKAVRKDVTAKCYGGDVSRKRKLLEKQKRGKKRMKQIGNVEVPQKAFLAVLKLD